MPPPGVRPGSDRVASASPFPGTLLLPPTHTAQSEGPSGYREAVELEFAEATKRYPGAEQPAVDALSLTVPAGEICVLVGPSGCGKTTAMRMVNRMIDISSGDILVGGRSVKGRNVDDLRREIGYVIQQIGLFPHRTIADNIATVPRLLGWDKTRVHNRVGELVDAITDPALVPAEHLRHGGDVLGDGSVREEPDLLDHVADLAPQVVDVAVAHAAAADEDVAAGDVDHPVDHPHRGGLAAAGRADEHADLAGGDGQGEAVDGGGVGAGIDLRRFDELQLDGFAVAGRPLGLGGVG